MPSIYPLVLDTSPSATFPSAATLATHDLADDTHGNLHESIGQAIVGLETRVGIVGSADATSLDYQSREVESTYTPVASTPVGSLTMPATWTGSYFRATSAKVGRLSIRGVATGTWAIVSGVPFLEVTMPSGWTAAAARECANGNGIAYQAAGLGNHAVVFPVVHAAATKVRFISRTNTADGWTYAIDGVVSPYAAVNGDTVFDGVFDVRLA